MPTNTYTQLLKTTVATATSSLTLDVSAISGYTDLELVANVQASTSGQALTIQFNNDGGTGSLYSNTGLRGNGTTATTFRQSNNTNMLLSNTAEPPTSNSFGLYNAKFLNYANTTTLKTVLVRGSSSSGIDALADLWRNTNAITHINIAISGGTISVGSTFSLYGIKAVGGDTTVKATGGIVTEDATYYYHTFKGSSTFTPLQSLTADILVVAGGASGGTRTGAYNAGGGGGGAGGLLTFTSQSLTAQPYTCIVGAGGSSQAAASYLAGNNGNFSQFGSLTQVVGGGGGARGTNTANNGSSGGSGGGGNFSGGSAGAGTASQGNNGGTGTSGAAAVGGGGGGAGAVGGNNSGNAGGVGGIGATSALINAMAVASSSGQFSSPNYYYAGGGGGGSYGAAGGAGGLGGGGNAGYSQHPTANVATSGTANTGGGGGAEGEASGSPSGAGGSGIIVLRYTKA